MHLTLDRELVLDFFLTFAAFEYALKSSGLFVRRRSSGKERLIDEARPDWDGFACQLHGVFRPDASPEFQQACDHLLANPPWREVVSQNTLCWDATAENEQLSEIVRVLRYVRRVRNNLFHGGKFVAPPASDSARNTKLLADSLVILRECLKLSDNVRLYHEAATL